jgi:Polyketide cyclase / dehydrase and lipid transport
MAHSYRHQALIDAPVGDVWEVVSDPRTHPDWWPEVVRIEASEHVGEGDEYVHTAKMVPFIDAVDAIWVVERMEELKEAQFRCTMTGSYARFQLTPAQDETYVEMEVGMDPTSFRWRLAEPIFGFQSKRWAMAVLDALPDAIRSRLGASAAPAAE